MCCDAHLVLRIRVFFGNLSQIIIAILLTWSALNPAREKICPDKVWGVKVERRNGFHTYTRIARGNTHRRFLNP
jgi:hypothetical protein